MKYVIKRYPDWTEFLVDGECVFSDHTLYPEDLLKILGIEFNVEYCEEDE